MLEDVSQHNVSVCLIVVAQAEVPHNEVMPITVWRVAVRLQQHLTDLLLTAMLLAYIYE